MIGLFLNFNHNAKDYMISDRKKFVNRMNVIITLHKSIKSYLLFSKPVAYC